MLNGLDLAGIKKLHAEYAEHAYKSDADPDWADMAHEHRGELLLEVERLRAEVADAREVQMIAVRQRDRANDSFVWFGGLDDKERVEKDENHRLRAALDSVVKHWREFGPEHGFDETLERAALARGAGATVHAQHDETGRLWSGPRAAIPKGYSEVGGAVPASASRITPPPPVSAEEMARPFGPADGSADWSKRNG